MLQQRANNKLLLTGASGFVGGFVQQARQCLPLLLNGREVDLRDSRKTYEAVDQIHPDAVLHLAAQTFVPRSFDDPIETFEINFIGTYNLLSALKKTGFVGRFLLISTGDVYGVVSAERLPITERILPRPRNPYAVSKLAAESLCLQWNETEDFRTIVARPFNHIGPGQRQDFVISGFAKQIAEIKQRAKAPVIDAGDLDVTRDFCDVRDIVRAYFLLLEKGRPGEIYNVCSGTEQSIRALLETMLEIADLEVEIKTDASRLRPNEQRRVCGDASKIRNDVGWKPSYTIEETLKETIHTWEFQTA